MTYYNKPSEKTMKLRQEEFADKYRIEIEWLSENKIAKTNNFLMDMLDILKTGSRPFTEKMHNAVKKSMNNPMYDEIKSIEREEVLRPIKEKVNRVWELVAEVDEHKSSFFLANYSALPFVDSLKEQLNKYGRLSEKQLLALNKVYKRYKKQWDKKQNDKKRT